LCNILTGSLFSSSTVRAFSCAVFSLTRFVPYSNQGPASNIQTKLTS
jgi:hypothetical protein